MYAIRSYYELQAAGPQRQQLIAGYQKLHQAETGTGPLAFERHQSAALDYDQGDELNHQSPERFF